ncbi:MAG: HEPN domain-containing protein [Phycisphaerae bacterium]
MKPPDQEPGPQLVAEWVSKASDDLAAAETLLTRDPPLLGPSCFHSQQAVEKYLKALLTHWNVEVPKTHDLGKLLQLIESCNSELASGLINVLVLNTYATACRYPGDQLEPDLKETRVALDLAREVRASITPLLSQLFKHPG